MALLIASLMLTSILSIALTIHRASQTQLHLLEARLIAQSLANNFQPNQVKGQIMRETRLYRWERAVLRSPLAQGSDLERVDMEIVISWPPFGADDRLDWQATRIWEGV